VTTTPGLSDKNLNRRQLSTTVRGLASSRSWSTRSGETWAKRAPWRVSQNSGSRPALSHSDKRRFSLIPPRPTWSEKMGSYPRMSLQVGTDAVERESPLSTRDNAPDFCDTLPDAHPTQGCQSTSVPIDVGAPVAAGGVTRRSRARHCQHRTTMNSAAPLYAPSLRHERVTPVVFSCWH
jgi:hypothetical protein